MTMSGTGHIRVYGYRWVILVVYALITAVLEVHWVNFAPITGEAARFYGVSPLEIGFLSMSFMLVYLVVCIPASYVIDTYGIRIGIGIGAVLTGMFGLLKGLYAADYQMILFCQIGLAVAQPFILNAITKVAANWFPLDERATAAGLATLSQFIGIILAMVLTPQLLKGSSMHTMLMVYGAASAACQAWRSRCRVGVKSATGVGAVSGGFVTVYPCGAARPVASNLNLATGGTSPNLVISKVGTGGKVCIFTQSPMHLLADLNGWYPAS